MEKAKKSNDTIQLAQVDLIQKKLEHGFEVCETGINCRQNSVQDWNHQNIRKQLPSSAKMSTMAGHVPTMPSRQPFETPKHELDQSLKPVENEYNNLIFLLAKKLENQREINLVSAQQQQQRDVTISETEKDAEDSETDSQYIANEALHKSSYLEEEILNIVPRYVSELHKKMERLQQEVDIQRSDRDLCYSRYLNLKENYDELVQESDTMTRVAVIMTQRASEAESLVAAKNKEMQEKESWWEGRELRISHLEHELMHKNLQSQGQIESHKTLDNNKKVSVSRRTSFRRSDNSNSIKQQQSCLSKEEKGPRDDVNSNKTVKSGAILLDSFNSDTGKSSTIVAELENELHMLKEALDDAHSQITEQKEYIKEMQASQNSKLDQRRASFSSLSDSLQTYLQVTSESSEIVELLEEYQKKYNDMNQKMRLLADTCKVQDLSDLPVVLTTLEENLIAARALQKEAQDQVCVLTETNSQLLNEFQKAKDQLNEEATLSKQNKICLEQSDSEIKALKEELSKLREKEMETCKILYDIENDYTIRDFVGIPKKIHSMDELPEYLALAASKIEELEVKLGQYKRMADKDHAQTETLQSSLEDTSNLLIAMQCKVNDVEKACNVDEVLELPNKFISTVSKIEEAEESLSASLGLILPVKEELSKSKKENIETEKETHHTESNFSFEFNIDVPEEKDLHEMIPEYLTLAEGNLEELELKLKATLNHSDVQTQVEIPIRKDFILPENYLESNARDTIERLLKRISVLEDENRVYSLSLSLKKSESDLKCSKNTFCFGDALDKSHHDLSVLAQLEGAKVNLSQSKEEAASLEKELVALNEKISNVHHVVHEIVNDHNIRDFFDLPEVINTINELPEYLAMAASRLEEMELKLKLAQRPFMKRRYEFESLRLLLAEASEKQMQLHLQCKRVVEFFNVHNLLELPEKILVQLGEAKINLSQAQNKKASLENEIAESQEKLNVVHKIVGNIEGEYAIRHSNDMPEFIYTIHEVPKNLETTRSQSQAIKNSSKTKNLQLLLTEANETETSLDLKFKHVMDFYHVNSFMELPEKILTTTTELKEAKRNLLQAENRIEDLKKELATSKETKEDPQTQLEMRSNRSESKLHAAEVVKLRTRIVNLTAQLEEDNASLCKAQSCIEALEEELTKYHIKMMEVDKVLRNIEDDKTIREFILIPEVISSIDELPKLLAMAASKFREMQDTCKAVGITELNQNSDDCNKDLYMKIKKKLKATSHQLKKVHHKNKVLKKENLRLTSQSNLLLSLLDSKGVSEDQSTEQADQVAVIDAKSALEQQCDVVQTNNEPENLAHQKTSQSKEDTFAKIQNKCEIAERKFDEINQKVHNVLEACQVQDLFDLPCMIETLQKTCPMLRCCKGRHKTSLKTKQNVIFDFLMNLKRLEKSF